ncbi:MAG: cytochrome c [Alphaproteobacteria bacterium]
MNLNRTKWMYGFIGLIAVTAVTMVAALNMNKLYASDLTPSQAYEARQVLMKSYGKSMKTIAGMFRGKIEYNGDELAKAASIIADQAGDKMTLTFTKDSIIDDSEALPIIWQEWDNFSALAQEVGLYAQALALSANNPRSDDPMGEISMLSDAEKKDLSVLSGLAPDVSFRLMAQNCSACHKAYRAD